MSKQIDLNLTVNKDKREVYALLKKMEDFPTFIKSIKKIAILERYPDKIITEWEVDIDGAIVRWKEEDMFDDTNTTIYFKMLKGDFKKYEGKWIIAEKKKKASKIYLSAHFDWGIPVFERFVGDVILRKAKVYLKGMLKAIERRIKSEK